MRREWKELFDPMKVVVPDGINIQEAYKILKENHTEVGFIKKNEEINGYFTKNTLFEQLINSDSKKINVVHQKDFLIVKEFDLVRKIYNCKIVIVVNNNEQPTGYIQMKDLDEKLASIHLNTLNKGLNSAEIGIVTLDKFFRVKFMNDTAEQILGMAKELFVRRDYRKIICSNENLESVLKGDRLRNIEDEFNYKKIIGQYSPIYKNKKIVGVIHNFYLKERFNQVINQVDFVKEMSNDLEMFYENSNEQIIITNEKSEIIKIGGAYFSSFFGSIPKEKLNGISTKKLAKQGRLYPDIVTACINKKEKIIMKQHSESGVILSTAIPVLEKNEIKKVIVLSKNITIEESKSNENQVKNQEIENPLVYQSLKMNKLMEEIRAVSPLNSTILITGESGVGKEVIAKTIHQQSTQVNEKFVAINCGAIPDNLIESELFGHEKGSFTGAHTARIGLFEQSNGGTVFLDEIGELPYAMQVKLLRVLQEKEIVRVGGTETIKVEFRVIAATNKNLLEEVRRNNFREDLYYRLHIVPLQIPALRDRPDDIAPLAVHFLEYFNSKFKRKSKNISYRALSTLEDYEWPGNIRELRNVIERLVIVSEKAEIDIQDVYDVLWSEEPEDQNKIKITKLMPLKEAVEETERQLIELALKKYKTAKKASEYLNVSMSTISRRKKRYDKMDGENN